MSYDSPVKLFIGEIKHQVDEQMEEACYTAVIEYFPHVDRAELMRALEYDRQQYEWGYRDAVADKDLVEVVRCKNCKHFDEYTSKCYVFCDNECEVQLGVDSDHFCSYGERKDNE